MLPNAEAIKKIMGFIEVKEEIVQDLLTGKPLMRDYVENIPNKRFSVFCEN